MSTPQSPIVAARQKEQLPQGLYALIDDGLLPELPLEDRARAALEGGAKVLQVRMKKTPPRPALAAIRAIVLACVERGAVCIVNDRVDLALVGGAHGVHLGEEDLPCEDARALLGERRLVGVTVRNLAQAEAAAKAGASYVGLGPIFPSETKPLAVPLLGVDGLSAIVAASPLPVVAISGIRLGNIAEVAAAGAHCAAVASDLLRAGEVAQRAGALCAAFESGRARRSLPAGS